LRRNVTSPIVIDLGKTQEEHVRALNGGAGELAGEVEEVLRLVRRDADAECGKRVFLPIVAIYAPAPSDQDGDDDRDDPESFRLPQATWTLIKRQD